MYYVTPYINFLYLPYINPVHVHTNTQHNLDYRVILPLKLL